MTEENANQSVNDFNDDDMILPDDFDPDADSQPQEDELTDQEQTAETTTEETAPEETPADNQEDNTKEKGSEETPSTPESFKIKYNGEEQEIKFEDAVSLIQKGMNYDKQAEKLQEVENDPALAFVKEEADRLGITPEQYIEAVRQEQQQQMIEDLANKGIPEDVAQEIIDNRKFRQQYEEQYEANKQKEEDLQRLTAEQNDFFQTFKEINGRDFIPNQDVIPDDVTILNSQGVPLGYAYLKHHAKTLQTQNKALQQNKQNIDKSPVGSVTENGSKEVVSKDPFMEGFDLEE